MSKTDIWFDYCSPTLKEPTQVHHRDPGIPYVRITPGPESIVCRVLASDTGREILKTTGRKTGHWTAYSCAINKAMHLAVGKLKKDGLKWNKRRVEIQKTKSGAEEVLIFLTTCGRKNA